MNIVIIDYGLCNLRSVHNALKTLKVESRVSSDPADLIDADAVILPGVGAFEKGMQGLQEKGFIEPIKKFVETGRPFLGICLGMQMLMSKSYEFGEFNGLNLIEGEVRPFKNTITDEKYDFKVPHIGWNNLLAGENPWNNILLDDIADSQEVYFVHSYFVAPKNQENVLSRTSYANQDFCSTVAKENIFGCQYHPEKSSDVGLKILNNFVRMAQNEHGSKK